MSDEALNKSAVSNWYSGKSILITGATGFLGKVLIEKLLRSCSDLDKIYVIIRPKRGQKPEERLAAILNTPLFEDMSKNHPDNVKKIVAVEGDITLPSLGIKPEDRAVLAQNVSIIFHSAATVKFDETLKSSILMNVTGTKELLSLSYEMKQLKAFIHVSTAYANCKLKEVDEIIYPSPIDLRKLIQCIDSLDDDILDEVTPRLLCGWPNTYTFSKALAENLLEEHAGKLPLVIFRPSIVTAAWIEPLPGWTDTINGPSGLILAAGKGVVRSLLTSGDNIADLIPVDVVINTMICLAWYTAQLPCSSIPVYHCSSGGINPLLWNKIRDLIRKWIHKYPQSKAVWYPDGSFKTNILHHKVACFLFHVVPAYIVDFISVAIGRKPHMVKTQKKIEGLLSILEYFTTREWKFASKNVPKLIDSLSEPDKDVFNCDIRDLDWGNYMKNYIIGIRHYMAKDSPDNLAAARRHSNRLKYLHYAVQGILLFLLFTFCFHNVGMAKSMVYYIYSCILYILYTARNMFIVF